MMTGSSRYDPELQMFVDEPRDLNLARLRFLRWLVERGRLEHGPAAKQVVRAPADRALRRRLQRLAVDPGTMRQGRASRAETTKVERRRDERG